MSYRRIFVSQNLRFSLDRHVGTGRAVLSIPVRNQMVEYEEYYSISQEELEQLLEDEALAKDFALRCASQLMDDRLVLKPGSDRGHYNGEPGSPGDAPIGHSGSLNWSMILPATASGLRPLP